jgi:hypothetical protein
VLIQVESKGGLVRLTLLDWGGWESDALALWNTKIIIKKVASKKQNKWRPKRCTSRFSRWC